MVATACAGSGDACLDRTPGVVCEVAGNGLRGFNGDDLDAQETSLYLVSRARRAPDGRVVLADFNNHLIRAIELDGSVKTIAGTGIHAYAFAGEPAVSSPLENPIDFDFLPNGEVVFAGLHDPRVLKLDADGIVRVIAGTGMAGADGDGGSAATASFYEINGLAVAPDGAIAIADSRNNRVRIVRGERVEALAGTGEAGFSGDGGDARSARLSYPTAITFAPDGALLIADRRNHAIRRVAVDGTITTVAGSGNRGFAGDGALAIDAELASPDGVAIASDGSILISDRENFRIRRVDPQGVITTIAGSGMQGHGEDSSPALETMFSVLARISTDGADGLFIADQGNSCVRHLVLDF